MRVFQLNRDKKLISSHTTTIRRECLSKSSPHATRFAGGSQVEVELEPEVKDPSKVGLGYVWRLFKF